MGCKSGCKTCKWLIFKVYFIPGGSRTLVQTRKPYAFYMLIFAFIFRVQARPKPPTCTLSSKISEESQGKIPPIPDFAVPLCQTLRNKSF